MVSPRVPVLLVFVLSCSKSPADMKMSTRDARAEPIANGPDVECDDDFKGGACHDASPDVESTVEAELGTPPTTVTWELAAPVGAACLAEVATATSDPRPDQACSQEHEVHCTFAGSYEIWSPDKPRCIKPYRVRCTVTASGLRWVAETCAIPPAACFHPKFNPPTCQEGERGASCCPLEYVGYGTFDGKEVETMRTRQCDEPEGTARCPGLHASGITACQYADGPVESPSIGSEWNAYGKKCSAWCKDCKYHYPVAYCKPILQSSCPGGSAAGKAVRVCVSLPGQEDRCAENCQDLIDAGFPWEPWKNEP